MNQPYKNQSGSVSLFIVIFIALLIITIATAFIRIMVQDQYQATSNDLSKSALDSANAGVEDAKRAILEYYKPDIATGKPNCSSVAVGANARCDVLRTALVGDITPPNDGWTSGCHATTIPRIASLTNGEVIVRSTNMTDNRDDQLNQAYTCIKVQMNPRDYNNKLSKDSSLLIPLKPMSGQTFTKIKLRWYIPKAALDLPSSSIPYEIPSSWPNNRPPVIRAQLLQYRSTFNISDFDEKDVTKNKNSFTLFFLPTSMRGLDTSQFTNDLRQNRSSLAAQPVSCSGAGSYACEVTVDLPCAGDPCTGYPGSNADRDAYLKLSQYFAPNDVDFTVSLLTDTGSEVRYGDVQVAVDSTGRANSVFRRIQSYIDLGTSSVPTIESAVDVTRSLCKEFLVTTDYAYPGRNSICPAPPTTP